MPYLFIFLSLTSHLLFSQDLQKLEPIHSLKFGMKESEVISQIKKLTKTAISTTERDSYKILKISLKENPNFNELRVFLSKDKGLFAIEEQIFFKWDHQIDDEKNLTENKNIMESVINLLRSKYGKENLLEETILDNRESNFRYVTASWKFANKEWAHVIYEPQDWTLYPEKIKIIILFRNSILDPRKSQLSKLPSSSSNSNL